MHLLVSLLLAVCVSYTIISMVIRIFCSAKVKTKKSIQSKIREFTEAAQEKGIPERLIIPSEVDRKWIAKMVISETVELIMTTGCDHATAVETACALARDDLVRPRVAATNPAMETIDALCDITYYIYDFVARHNIDLDSFIRIVHKANMNKRDPETKKFIRDSEGKILKPPGWVPRDDAMRDELLRQLEEDSGSMRKYSLS